MCECSIKLSEIKLVLIDSILSCRARHFSATLLGFLSLCWQNKVFLGKLNWKLDLFENAKQILFLLGVWSPYHEVDSYKYNCHVLEVQVPFRNHCCQHRRCAKWRISWWSLMNIINAYQLMHFTCPTFLTIISHPNALWIIPTKNNTIFIFIMSDYSS